MKTKWIAVLWILFFGSWAQADVRFSTLVINGKHRDAINEIINGFEAENHGVKVIVYAKANDAYNDYIISGDWTKKADVVWYFGGYQLKNYIKSGLIEPVDDLWAKQGYYDKLQNMKNLVAYREHVYAVPISYYQWGIYYKKSVFKKFDLKEPATWAEFEKICDVLKDNGIIPIVLGVNEPRKWTAAAWFSYVNLRINGLAFHTQLLDGGVSFLDGRVRKVFETLKSMRDKGYFNSNLGEINRRGVYPYLYRDLAGMTLIGNFATNDFQPAYYDTIGFFRFPIIDQSIPVYEEAPTDVLFINREAKNKDEAKKFIAYWARPEILSKYNSTLGFLSPFKGYAHGNDYFISAGLKILTEAKGFSQYFNRDTSVPMSESSLDVLGNFMIKPDVKLTMEELDRYSRKYLRQGIVE